MIWLALRLGKASANRAAAPEITCPRYDPVPGTKRCKHYLKGSTCSLPDEFMCVEWLKANGHRVPPPLPPLSVESEHPYLLAYTSGDKLRVLRAEIENKN